MCQRRLDTGKDSFTGANGALANTRLVVGTTSTGPNLTITGSVLTNDPDIDTPTRLTAGPALISSANCAGCNNVTMEPDGNFIYDPPAGFTGNDTFTYTVNDNDPDTPPNQTDTATVTIEVVGPLVWYVDIDAAAPPAGQGGRSHSPFNSLAPLTTGGTADGLDGAGDIIFVGVDTAPATGPYEGGFVLEANQRLWGEPFGLNVDPTGPIPATQLVAATPGTPVANNPNIRNTALGGNGITLANGVDIQRINAGVNSTASNAAGISGTAITTATIGPNQLIQGNATGITLSGAAGGNVTIAATISGNSATAVSVANRSSGTVTVSGDVSGTAGNAAVILTNNTGATIVFTGAINLAGTGAAISKFSATGGGTITANNAANQITGFTGTGITLGGVTIGAAGVTFNTVSTAPAGAANGILLTNVAGGAFTVNNGAITATARALDVDDNSGNVTIGATLTTSGAAARSVEVTNRDGGIVDINGLVTDTSQGINLTTNGTGTIRFDGGIVASTTTFTAFNATGGGTIAVTDINGATVPNNTLTTTTGTALNVANTNIHADGLTFQSISANGGANGIVLNTTGSAGGLTVTGTGAAGTGGTIQNTTSDGVRLLQTTNPSLSWMNINDSADSGIFVDAVGGLNLVSLFMDSNGAQSEGGAIQDSGIHIEDLIGTGNTLSNSTIQDSRNTNLDWDPNSSTSMSTLTVSGTNLNHAGEGVSSQGNAGINLVATGTANVKLVVSGGQIRNNAAAGILVTGGSGTTVQTDIDGVDMVSSAPPADPGGASWGNGVGTNFGISLGSDGSSIQRHEVTNVQLAYTGIGPFDGGAASAIGLVPSGAGSFSATISGNTIGLVGAPRSGNENFFGIAADIRDSATVRLNVSNNIVRNTALNGIFIQTRDPSAVAGAIDADVTVRNNTVGPISDDDDFPFGAGPNQAETHAIRIESRNDSNLCLDLAGNSADGLGGNQDYLVRQRDTSTFNLERLTGNAADVTNIESFVVGQNPTPGGQTARATVATTYTAVADGTCQNPAPPT